MDATSATEYPLPLLFEPPAVFDERLDVFFVVDFLVEVDLGSTAAESFVFEVFLGFVSAATGSPAALVFFVGFILPLDAASFAALLAVDFFFLVDGVLAAAALVVFFLVDVRVFFVASAVEVFVFFARTDAAAAFAFDEVFFFLAVPPAERAVADLGVFVVEARDDVLVFFLATLAPRRYKPVSDPPNRLGKGPPRGESGHSMAEFDHRQRIDISPCERARPICLAENKPISVAVGEESTTYNQHSRHMKGLPNMNFARTILLISTSTALLLTFGCSSGKSDSDMAMSTSATPPAVATAETTHPLGVGDQVPDATLTTPAGKQMSFKSIYRDQPTVLVFYRGGWCPYCTRHLSEVGAVESKLRDLGYQIIAVSPDKPEELQSTLDKSELDYQLFSDSNMTLARRFGLAFVVDDATIERYKGFNIDLERSSGYAHHELPVPAVYILDKSGTIRFAHSNPDYRVRLTAEEVMNAATKAARQQ